MDHDSFDQDLVPPEGQDTSVTYSNPVDGEVSETSQKVLSDNEEDFETYQREDIRVAKARLIEEWHHSWGSTRTQDGNAGFLSRLDDIFEFLEKKYLEQMKENLQQKDEIERLKDDLRHRTAAITHEQPRPQIEETDSNSCRADEEQDEGKVELASADAQLGIVDRERLVQSNAYQSKSVERWEAAVCKQESIQASNDALRRSYQIQLKQIQEYETLLGELKLKEARMVTEYEGRYRSEVDRLEEINALGQLEIEELRAELESKGQFERKSHEKIDINTAAASDTGETYRKPTIQVKNSSVVRHHRRPVLDSTIPGGIPENYRGLFITQGRLNHNCEMIVKVNLIRAEIAVNRERYEAAEQIAFEASNRAELLENKAIISKCAYWRGRAELGSKKFTNAVYSFELARDCQGRYIEGEELEMRLAEARQGIPVDLRAQEGASLSDQITVGDSGLWTRERRGNEEESLARYFPYSKSEQSGAATSLNGEESSTSEADSIRSTTLSFEPQAVSGRMSAGPLSFQVTAPTPSSLNQSGLLSAREWRMKQDEKFSLSARQRTFNRGELDWDEPSMRVQSKPERRDFETDESSPSNSEADSYGDSLSDTDSITTSDAYALPLRRGSNSEQSQPWVAQPASPIQERLGRRARRRGVRPLRIDTDKKAEFKPTTKREYNNNLSSMANANVASPDRIPDPVTRVLSEARESCRSGSGLLFPVSNTHQRSTSEFGYSRPNSLQGMKPPPSATVTRSASVVMNDMPNRHRDLRPPPFTPAVRSAYLAPPLHFGEHGTLKPSPSLRSARPSTVSGLTAHLKDLRRIGRSKSEASRQDSSTRGSTPIGISRRDANGGPHTLRDAYASLSGEVEGDTPGHKTDSNNTPTADLGETY